MEHDMTQTSSDSISPILTMAGISKRYGKVQALDDVRFELRAGEVMALLGENGAGKSTTVKILSGLITADHGEIMIDGKPAHLGSSAASQAAGIAVVQQELSLVPNLSAAENIFLGGGSFKGLWTMRKLAAAARPFLDQVGLSDLDPATLVGSLSVGEMQLVEIARLLARDARILILDEPTAALSDVEIGVKKVVRDLADSGRAVIYVSHRLGEVFEIGDRATVFRNGTSSEPFDLATVDMATLVERMLGRRLGEMFPPKAGSIGDVRLAITDLEVIGLEEPLTLSARAGEILGLGGQLGSGAPSVLRAIAGVMTPVGGSIVIDGVDVAGASQRTTMNPGVAYCSDDRKRDGTFANKTVLTNLSSTSLNRVSTAGWLSRSQERALGKDICATFTIDPKRLESNAGTLSGGNQQKVALGKWLGIEPKVLLVEEPTRGVDVGARAEIYTHLRKLADAGMTIVFVSSDLPEVIGFADTVAAFYRGRMVSCVPAHQVTEASLMRDVTHRDESGESDKVGAKQ
jgi:ribose transport system ATP-binding protein